MRLIIPLLFSSGKEGKNVPLVLHVPLHVNRKRKKNIASGAVCLNDGFQINLVSHAMACTYITMDHNVMTYYGTLKNKNSHAL